MTNDKVDAFKNIDIQEVSLEMKREFHLGPYSLTTTHFNILIINSGPQGVWYNGY